MNTEAFNELNQFFVELQRESDRGLALVGPAHIDEKLLQVLTAFRQRESDRGLALVGPAHIDEKLLQVLT
ncbi:hypothetical protein KC902_04325, partial [Candidatus Kaiserbacteria bacterium]|nr:hypothetical protein [Candidatus Kaiserbacteria bacterium]